MVERTPDSLSGKRDRALLVLGFAGGLRRSEIAALEAQDVRPAVKGIELIIRKSKTDQERLGAESVSVRARKTKN